MAPKCEKTYMPSILAGYLYNWMQVPRCERRTGRALLRDLVVWGVQYLDKKITMAAKVGLVWPDRSKTQKFGWRVFVASDHKYPPRMPRV